MLHLLSLPHEVLHHVITEADPQDLAALSRCCQMLNGYIKHNRLLFKELYLDNYDFPPQEPNDAEPCWEIELPKLVSFEKLLTSRNRELKKSQFSTVAGVVSDILNMSSVPGQKSRNIELLGRLFSDEQNKEIFLCSSALFARQCKCYSRRFISTEAGSLIRAEERERKAASTELERQLSAKLHCLYGCSIDHPDDPIHPAARAKVYDLRQYTDHTFWGPFLNDGSGHVDWEKMEAIMVVLQYNVRRNKDDDGLGDDCWRKPFVGSMPKSFVQPAPTISLSMEPSLPLAATDPVMLRECGSV